MSLLSGVPVNIDMEVEDASIAIDRWKMRFEPGYVVTLGKCRSFNLPGVGSGSMFGTYVHRMNSSSARLDDESRWTTDG